ncbi:MAG: hypothetical protein ACK4UJ_07335 [Leptonema sp. (in: bacteria)]
MLFLFKNKKLLNKINLFFSVVNRHLSFISFRKSNKNPKIAKLWEVLVLYLKVTFEFFLDIAFPKGLINNIYKIYLILSLVGFLFCSFSKRPHWILHSEINSNGLTKNIENITFQFFIEPNSNKQEIEILLSDLSFFIKTLKTYPYLSIIDSNYNVVIYRNYKSYTAYRPFEINSLAHFDRKHKEIHIPLTLRYQSKEHPTPNFVIYHELIHAFLEECCNTYPIWLNEGLSLLLQNVQQNFECKKTKIKFFGGLLQNKNKLLKKHWELPFHPKFETLYSIYDQNLLSGFYIYYLWENHELMNIIHLTKTNQSIFDSLTNNDLKKYQILKDKFNNWLRKLPSYEYSIHGC